MPGIPPGEALAEVLSTISQLDPVRRSQIAQLLGLSVAICEVAHNRAHQLQRWADDTGRLIDRLDEAEARLDECRGSLDRTRTELRKTQDRLAALGTHLIAAGYSEADIVAALNDPRQARRGVGVAL